MNCWTQRNKLRLEEEKSSVELAASQRRLQRQKDRFQQMLGDPEQGIDTSGASLPRVAKYHQLGHGRFG
jgi:hypothetical protein